MTETVTWADWVEYHSSFFGWREDRDRKMLMTWAKFFDDECYGPEELVEATKKIPKSDPKAAPFKREDHIHHLIEAVRVKRESLRVVNKSDHYFDCKICSGSGLVRVPRLKDVINYSWRSKYACYVSCSCVCGVMFQSPKNDRPMMSLREYEGKNSEWKNQIRMAEDTERKLNEMLLKDKPPTHLDKLIDGFIKRFQIKPRGSK
jgi:hypothetical protein